MKRAAIIRLDHLGDIILMTPLARALSRSGWICDVIVPGFARAVWDHSPHVLECHAIESLAPAFPADWLRLARWLRSRRYDALLLPYGRPRQLLWASAFSGTPKRVAMWSGVWGRLTGHRALRSRINEEPRAFAGIVLELGRELGVEPCGILPELFPTESEIADIRAMCRSFGNRPLVGIHPGCAGNACNLPAPTYGEVVRLLIESTDAAVVVTGTAEERKLTVDWPEFPSDRFLNLTGQLHLRQLFALISQLKVYVCPSTGPLHAASSLNVPTVSPFCPLPPLSASIWGNQRANATVLCPNSAACEIVHATRKGHCDFRGEITPSQIAEKTVAAMNQPIRS